MFQIRLTRTTLVVYCKKLTLILQNIVLVLQKVLFGFSYQFCYCSQMPAPTDLKVMGMLLRGYDLKLWGM